MHSFYLISDYSKRLANYKEQKQAIIGKNGLKYLLERIS